MMPRQSDPSLSRQEIPVSALSNLLSFLSSRLIPWSTSACRVIWSREQIKELTQAVQFNRGIDDKGNPLKTRVQWSAVIDSSPALKNMMISSTQARDKFRSMTPTEQAGF